MKLLLVSNGHGEDVIAAEVGRMLRKHDCSVRAVPMIGAGRAYEREGIDAFGPRRVLPSGGYMLRGPTRFFRDVRAGLVRVTAQVWTEIRRRAQAADAVFVVGDVYAISAASVFGSGPRFYLPSAVSVMAWPPRTAPWQQPYGPLERRLMRGSLRVYARDRASATWLTDHGVGNAVDAGNPMLDAVRGGDRFELPGPYLLLLPGTREDRWFSLPRMLAATTHVGDLGLRAVVAWSGSDDPPAVDGWRYERTSVERGIVGRYVRNDVVVAIARGAFAHAVRGARIAISTSGTAAEQCAGLGVPLVGFVTRGPQYTAPFAQGQKRALGAALELTSHAPEAIASAVRMFHADEARRASARDHGRLAMGEAGASGRIADDVVRTLASSASATMR